MSSFLFITGNEPAALKANSNIKTKSYLSKRTWATSSSERAGKRDRNQRQKLLTQAYEYVEVPGSSKHDQPTANRYEYLVLPMDHELGGGRVDPFRSTPGKWEPWVPAIIDHYLVHMATDIPELDQPNQRGLLKTRWFPLVISDVAAFQTILLLSASNLAIVSNGTQTPGIAIMQMRLDTVNYINDAISDPQRSLSDASIGAVAKMATFEALHGDIESFRIHMQGLSTMVVARGGLNNLGLNGLLRRIILWIDLNASFILDSPRSFSEELCEHTGDSVKTVCPNPEQFTAPWKPRPSS